MSVTFSTRRQRIVLNCLSSDTLQAISLWASNTTSLEFGLFAGQPGAGTIVDDVSNLSTITAKLYAADAQGGAPDPDTAEVLATVTSNAFSTPSYTQWEGGTGQHAQLELTSAQLNRDAGKYWLAFTLTTSSGGVVSFGVAVTLNEDGDNGSASEPEAPETLVFPTQTDARYALFSASTVRTALTGGAAGALDAEATVSLAVSTTLRAAVVGGQLGWWQLVAGTDAEDAGAGIVRPDDFNASTNAKVWKQVL